MATIAGVAPALLARARVDQVTIVYASWHRTTVSMLLGGTLLCLGLWPEVGWTTMAAWASLVVANQAWRGLLARGWQRAHPGPASVPRWGRYWAAGSTASGALWGAAAWLMYPASPAYEALLIVCLFGVVMAGLNLTAVFRPSFYGFVLCALVPLIVRVAIEGDRVHLYTALVLAVVLAFVLGFGHRVNDALTHAAAIRYANVDLIGELKAQTRAALDARAAAEAADRAKSQLLAAASHDLRQPLHALALFVAALDARTRGHELAPLVSRVQQSLEALDGQFAQLLDLSRLEAGALSPERARVPLAPLFARIVAEFAPQAQAKGLRLRALPTRLAVDSDPAMLERILRNLVANAVRYTRHGGAVVGARRRGHAVAIEVADTGIGIAPEDRAHIFEEFYQGREARRAAGGHRGMGLGLAIVRRLAALLGHPLAVTSRPGRGSRFALLVPRVTDVRRGARTMSIAPATAVARTREGALGGATIVVIDDDPAAIEAMRALFTTRGATVAGGHDARSALAALAAAGTSPDLVVADLRLDESSGLDAVARIRDALQDPVPALIVSGDTGSEALREVRHAGLTLLPKPVVPGSLEAAAEALVAARLTANA